MDKKAWRVEMRARRNQIAMTQRLTMNKVIEELAIKAVEKYHTIACYVSFQSEVDTHPLIHHLMDTHQVVVPRVVNQTTMEFVKVHPHTNWYKSKYGMEEPSDGEVIAIADIDCFIVPLLAFDQQGNRLGYGGGYYDRIFVQSNAYRIGLAYDIQAIQQVPIEPWDITLHQVITPTSC